MKFYSKLITYILLSILVISNMSFAKETNSTEVLKNLTVEYAKTPLGVDTKVPRFGWQSESSKRNFTQVAYQIIVKNPVKKTVWDSGKIYSDISNNIDYSGEELKPTVKYDWSVKIWNNKGDFYTSDSWFETSFLSPSISAWDGAKWIGGNNEDLVLCSQYLPIYKLSYNVKLDKESKTTKAGFIFGANDPRLMDKNKNINNSENKINDSYIKLEIDISKVDGSEKGLATLNLYRVGYVPADKKDIPLLSYHLPLTVINNNNKYDVHSVYLESNFGSIDIKIDGTKYEIPKEASPSPFINKSVNINPMGFGSDYIAFPMLGEIGFAVEAGQKASFSGITVSNYRSPSNVLFSEKIDESYNGIFSKKLNNSLQIKENSLVIGGDKNGNFVVADPSKNAMPMLKTEFNSNKKVSKARLYITARGVYEAYINGQRVGDDYFNPGLTQYDKNQMYQTYDITTMIKSGDNAIGIMLGEGWWSGNATFIGKAWNYFGDRQSVLAKLVVTYEDGTSKVIISNPSDWKYYNDGPIKYGSFFQGEVYDATKESAIKDWTTSAYDDKNWKKAVEVSVDGTTNKKGEIFNYGPMKLMEWMDFQDFNKTNFLSQVNDSVKVVKELTAKSVKEVRPGVFIYDMGQNMVGIPKINIANGEAGKKITIRYAEVVYPNLPEYSKNVGMVMLENLRGAMVQDTYILKGGIETIEPRFTYHGYRYLEITGINKALPVESVKGKVLSSVKEITSSYETSNTKVNKLWENITWSTRSNFLSIPTDCPQRNERMGWSGDISVFSRTATYLTDSSQFLRRHLMAMRDTQNDEGRFDDVAPIGGGFGGILWGSAGITVAWEAYEQYGDKTMLKEHYDSMVKYIDYLAKTGATTAGFLGDWLSPEGSQMGPNEQNFLIWDAYYAYDLELMSKIAKQLGKNGDSNKYIKMCEEQKSLFNKKYINPNTKKTVEANTGKLIDTQASYSIPLALGVIKDEYKADFSKNLSNSISRKNKDASGVERPEYSLMTGFIGTTWINKALSDNGYMDIAYKLLQQNSYPSWLYSVDQGSTTIWERLNSYTTDKGFDGNNSMNSFNHYSFGAIGAWMYNYSLGIERDENSPGFKHFILQPNVDPTGNMTYAKGHYDSIYGRIESSWSIKNDNLIYTATVPANTSATLYLPVSDLKSIKENGKKVVDTDYIKFIKYEAGKAVYEVKSGKYSFESKL